MGKDLVPRFKCPLCGWLAYYSMLDRGPYKLEIKGMRYDGFQEISYHHIWTGKKEYKEYLRLKVRELAKNLGIKLADEEDAAAEYEEEVETEPVEEVRVEKPSRRVAEKVATPSQTIIQTESITEDIDDEDIGESVVAEVDEKVVEVLRQLMKRTPSSQIDRKPSSFSISTDSQFIDLGGENNG